MPKFFSFLFCFYLALFSFGQDRKNYQDASYYMFRNSDSAFYFSSRAISEAKDSSDYYNGKFFLGQCIFWQGYIDSSLQFYNKVENYFQRSKDSLKLMEIFFEKGSVLKVVSKYDQSYDYLMRALHIAKSRDSLRVLALLNISLAEHARSMGDSSNAFLYIERAFNMNNISPLKGDDLAELYHRKAAIEHEFGKPEEAVKFSFESLKISEATGNLHQQATSYNELGFYYSNHPSEGLKNENNPLEYYLKAEAIWKKLNYKRYYIWAWRNISREYGNNKDYVKSNKLLKEILAVSEPNHWDAVTSDVCLQAAQNFEDLHKADSALFYYKKYMLFREKTETRFKSKEFQDMLLKYASLQKEQTIRKQEEDTFISKLEEERNANRKNIIILIVGFVIILIVAIRVFRK